MSTNIPATKFQLLRTKHDATVGELSRYKLLVDSIEDYAIFLMDPGGYIKTWNKGAQKNKGYTAEEIIDKHFSVFYQKQDVDAKKPERELDIAKRYGRVEDEDWRVRKDGSKFWANVVITALFDEDGTLVGFAKVTRNLTERKRHEDDLRSANTVLKKQQRQLEALNISKDEFVSLASHQLRTPATGIKQLLGLLLEGFNGPLEPTHRAIIEKAYESNERQLAIVNSLLKVAQIDNGKVTLKKTKTDISELLNSIVEGYADTFNERDQTFSVQVDKTGIESVLLDSEHFRMALENIVDNASKYTYEGGTINMTARKDGKRLKISIQDNGIGISATDMDRIFDRFSRITNDLSSSVGGSGLGLYWTEKVISLHGGSIEVDSELNEGTTFNVYIPMGSAHA